VSARAAEILLDVHPALFGAGGGIPRYVRDLCAALRAPEAPPARLAFPRNLGRAAAERFPEFAHQEVPLAWWQLRVLMMLAAPFGRGLDEFYGEPAVFHSPLGCGPLFDRARLVVNVHDLTFLEHPEWHPARTTAFLGVTVPRAARAAARVIFHSRAVRDRAVPALGLRTERTLVLPPPLSDGFIPLRPAAATARVRERFGLATPFVLHVGTIEPRKNHVTLVEAWERMRRAGFPGPLVLVGHVGWKARVILARLERSPDAPSIVRLSNLVDEDLVALYGAAAVVAFPSLEEGFGMPLLEAMACGAPCVTSDDPVLVELGLGHARAVPATDVEALAAAMLAVANDADAGARAAATGPAHAARFGFTQWKERLLAIYDAELEAAGAPRASRSGAIRARSAW